MDAYIHHAFPVTLIGALLLIPASYAIEPDYHKFGVLDGLKANIFGGFCPGINCWLVGSYGS